MRDLEIISELGYKSACITISRMGWRTKEPESWFLRNNPPGWNGPRFRLALMDRS